MRTTHSIKRDARPGGGELARPLQKEAPLKYRTQKVERSSRTGKFVTARFAKRHKATTQRDTLRVPVKTKRRRK